MARRTIARYVLIDLEFDDVRSAQSMLGGLWERFHVMRNPRARIVEVVEERALAGSAGAA